MKGIIKQSMYPLMTIFLGMYSPHIDAKKIKPNIVFIMADDLGWRDLGVMGSDYYETPNIDRLASQGVLFTNAYAAAANSAPCTKPYPNLITGGRAIPPRTPKLVYPSFTIEYPAKNPASSSA